MTAEEAAHINDHVESVDNSNDIIARIEAAARSRKRSVEVTRHEMTFLTRSKLEQLGYFISARTKSSPTPRNWLGETSIFVVSW